MPVSFSVIIPAYNEAQTIERAIRETVRAFQAFGSYEIVVVDDGSTDLTATIVRSIAKRIPEVRIIRHPKNQGKGAAVKAGVLAARGMWALFLDADLATQPTQFKKFLPFLKKASVIIGSRRMVGAQIVRRQPFYRIWAGRLFNAFIRWYVGLNFQDTQCGFKAFHRRTFGVFKALDSKGWAFDVEVLLRAQNKGFRIQEVPVIWRNGRESRVRLSDGWGIFQELRRIRGVRRDDEKNDH